jgi:hypothetical protein
LAAVSADRCRAAVAALDRALDDRPDKAVVVSSSRIASWLRQGAAGNRRCNAILSTVVGGEHPLGGIRRDRLRKACDGLGFAAL